MDCPLCQIFEEDEIHLKVYYRSPYGFIILDCEILHIPIVVFEEHGTEPPRRLKVQMMNRCRALFGGNIEFQMNQRKAKDHFHFHVIQKEVEDEE